MSLVAVVWSTLVRSACVCPRTIASIVRSVGFHSSVYLTCTRRATTSKGGESREVLRIVQPLAPRVTATCSLPTGTPLKKTAKFEAVGGRVVGGIGNC